MSYGKMNSFIDLIEKQTVKDAEGFSTETDVILASVRAYREGRHGNEKWANRAQFSEATDHAATRGSAPRRSAMSRTRSSTNLGLS